MKPINQGPIIPPIVPTEPSKGPEDELVEEIVSDEAWQEYQESFVADQMAWANMPWADGGRGQDDDS